MRKDSAVSGRVGDPEAETRWAETASRFCPTCLSFHESRTRFLPGEAPDFAPPGCYFQGRRMPTGWCHGSAYREDIP